MHGPRNYYTKRTKLRERKTIICYCLYVKSKKRNTNELQNRNKPTDKQNKFMVTIGEIVGEG